MTFSQVFKDILTGTHVYFTDFMDKRALCTIPGVSVSDLHIGKTIAFRQSGVIFPKKRSKLADRVYDRIPWQQAFGFERFDYMFEEGKCRHVPLTCVRENSPQSF